jgi:hypothetical protein
MGVADYSLTHGFRGFRGGLKKNRGTKGSIQPDFGLNSARFAQPPDADWQFVMQVWVQIKREK